MNIGMKKFITLLIFLIGSTTAIFSMDSVDSNTEFDAGGVPLVQTSSAKITIQRATAELAMACGISKVLAIIVMSYSYRRGWSLAQYFRTELYREIMVMPESRASRLLTKKHSKPLKEILSGYAENAFAGGTPISYCGNELATLMSLALVSTGSLEEINVSAFEFLSFVGYCSLIERALSWAPFEIDVVELAKMAIRGKQLETLKFFIKKYPALCSGSMASLEQVANECFEGDEDNKGQEILYYLADQRTF